jgi:hypothetical protein
MRTTIDIPDGMYRRLKAKAAADGKPVKALILRGVDHILTTADKVPKRKLVAPVIASTRPGSMQLDNARIYEIISFP